MKVRFETATTVGHLGDVNATELRFWRRRLRRVGGSLTFHAEPVIRAEEPSSTTHLETITIEVPTAGSDTFLRAKSGKSASRGDRNLEHLRKLAAAAGGGSGRGGTAADAEGDERSRGGGGGGAAAAAPAPAPAPASAPASTSTASSTPTPQPLTFKVLYIEDERVQAYFFINKCRRVFGERCVVVHETDGVPALERLQTGEQFVAVVSDIFMAGMDGVSFFHALFSNRLNVGSLVRGGGGGGGGGRELRLNLILTGAEIEPDREEDEELNGELAALSERFGVLVYNKTSGVDVVNDVIAPHVKFVETRLAMDAAAGGGGGGGGGGSGGSGGARRRRSGGRDGDGDDDDDEYDASDEARRDDAGYGGGDTPSVSFGSRQTTRERAAAAAGARGGGGGDGRADSWEGKATSYALVARSESSMGGRGRPFPDTSSLRARGGSVDDDDDDAAE